jgi:hypothetical protein
LKKPLAKPHAIDDPQLTAVRQAFRNVARIPFKGQIVAHSTVNAVIIPLVRYQWDSTRASSAGDAMQDKKIKQNVDHSAKGLPPFPALDLSLHHACPPALGQNSRRSDYGVM